MNIETKIRKKVLLLPFRLLLHPNSQAGSVAIVVALSMIVLLTMFAFVIDTGYLYGEKNKFQNGVEAAAMAGAVSLCDADPEGVARQVAIYNGLPAGPITEKTTLDSLGTRISIFQKNNFIYYEELKGYNEAG